MELKNVERIEQAQQDSRAKNFAKKAGALATLAALGVTAAHAEGTTIDVGDVVSTITNGVSIVSAIGVAVLSLVVVIKVFKWARSAM
ncbi:major capsid protein [Acinetobacter thermotolerans]|uniref:major capsid protein n=1 Tax=Acinetobacter thermotolerans TaxID=3151487 RepID=UPI00325BF357